MSGQDEPWEAASLTGSVDVSLNMGRVAPSVRKGLFQPVPGPSGSKESVRIWDLPLYSAVFLIPRVPSRNNSYFPLEMNFQLG